MSQMYIFIQLWKISLFVTYNFETFYFTCPPSNKNQRSTKLNIIVLYLIATYTYQTLPIHRPNIDSCIVLDACTYDEFLALAHW